MRLSLLAIVWVGVFTFRCVAADSPTLTMNSQTYTMTVTSFSMLSFPVGVTSEELQATFNGEQYQVTMPTPNLFALSDSYVYVLSQTPTFNEGFDVRPWWEDAATSSFWLNSYSDPDNFTILSSDTSQTGQVITLQVHCPAASQYFWKTVFCSSQVVCILTTWYSDPTNPAQADHQAFVASFSRIQ